MVLVHEELLLDIETCLSVNQRLVLVMKHALYSLAGARPKVLEAEQTQSSNDCSNSLTLSIFPPFRLHVGICWAPRLRPRMSELLGLPAKL